MPYPVSIALIVCTRNRAARLAAALASMQKLQCSIPWSMIVVDNGSTDNTREVILAAERAFPVPVTYIYEKTPGLGNAHNAAVRATDAELLAFTDDDCYPEPTYLADVVQCFNENPRIGFLGGRILLHDPDDLPATIQVSTDRVDFAPRSFIRAGIIQGANFACRRAAVVGVGGFDPWFGPGAFFNAEEVDLLARLSAAGWSGAYDPRPTVSHHHGRKLADAGKLFESYSHGCGAYYAKVLFNPKLTWVCLEAFVNYLRHGWRRMSRREMLSGGIEYLVRAMDDRGRRFAGNGFLTSAQLTNPKDHLSALNTSCQSSPS